jgi:hypothetical protein
MVTFTSNIPEVLVNNARIESGDTRNFTVGTTTLIEWWIPTQPLLPIMFIFGMVGLVSMFYGSWQGVKEFQDKKYVEAGVYSLVFIALGAALFLAWVFG